MALHKDMIEKFNFLHRANLGLMEVLDARTGKTVSVVVSVTEADDADSISYEPLAVLVTDEDFEHLLPIGEVEP